MCEKYDPRKLEPYFSEWMDKLTVCELHDKADIACQLAAQSKKIARLEEDLSFFASIGYFVD